METAGGTFSPTGLDKATQILLDEVPAPPSTGDLLDIGCGWGPIALALALRSPDATVWAVIAVVLIAAEAIIPGAFLLWLGVATGVSSIVALVAIIWVAWPAGSWEISGRARMLANTRS